MAYLSDYEIDNLGFKYVGKNVKISDKASIYDPQNISIGDNSRVDDFCLLSGNLNIGRYCHITPMCLLAGGKPGITLSDFCTLAYGVKVFSQSDDYSGNSMVNSLIPTKYKKETMGEVILEKQVIVGANATITPGVRLSEGCSVGAATLVIKSTEPWGIYAGVPAKRIKERSKKLLELEKDFLKTLDIMRVE